jgi:hypothetical protein
MVFRAVMYSAGRSLAESKTPSTAMPRSPDRNPILASDCDDQYSRGMDRSIGALREQIEHV